MEHVIRFNPVTTSTSNSTHLNMMENSLNGTFPSYFGNLSRMKYLNIYDNKLNGEISLSLRHLALLEQLNLGANLFLASEIPSFLGNLTQLTYLDFRANEFVGKIPLSQGNIIQLTHLDLYLNQLTGEIPSSIRNLVKLTHLDLSANNLTSEIPSSIGNLVRLTRLYLYENKLIDEIPFSFENLIKLKYLHLYSNELTGEIPSLMGRLTQLVYVDLSANKFYGPIPHTITQLQRLRLLDLISNNLSSVVRLDLFSNAQKLVSLYLSFNKLSIIFDPNITKQYTSLSLASCKLSSFPKFLQHQHGLQALDLSNNDISSAVPKWFLNVSTISLLFLNLSGNFLTSFAQNPVIFKWTTLMIIDLGFNELQGSLPILHPRTIVYFISNNHLSGHISLLLCNLSSIKILDLSVNNLFGRLLQCLSNLSGSLEYMSLHSNRFHGEIP